MSAAVTIKDRAMDMEIQQVPWWNRRTRMERRFFILSIFLLLATIGLSIALAGVLYKDLFGINSDNPVRAHFVISDSPDSKLNQDYLPKSNPFTPRIVDKKDVTLGNGKQVNCLNFYYCK